MFIELVMFICFYVGMSMLTTFTVTILFRFFDDGHNKVDRIPNFLVGVLWPLAMLSAILYIMFVVPEQAGNYIFDKYKEK